MTLETLHKREITMNIHEVASLLGLSESLPYWMAAGGKIPSVHFGGAIRFDSSELAYRYENRLRQDSHNEPMEMQPCGIQAGPATPMP
jgi:excisionase family DNA binding protein